MFKDSNLDPSTYVAGATNLRDYALELEGHRSFIRRNRLRADRPPTPQDDSEDGYGRGSTWLQDYQQTQIVWMCMDSTPGDARWSAFAYGQAPLTFPFDMGFIVDQVLFFSYDLGFV